MVARFKAVKWVQVGVVIKSLMKCHVRHSYIEHTKVLVDVGILRSSSLYTCLTKSYEEGAQESNLGFSVDRLKARRLYLLPKRVLRQFYHMNYTL